MTSPSENFVLQEPEKVGNARVAKNHHSRISMAMFWPSSLSRLCRQASAARSGASTGRRPEWAVYQLTVFSQRARSQPAERKEVTAAHEKIEQKLTKETKGVVCYNRPEAGVDRVSVFSFQPEDRGALTEPQRARRTSGGGGLCSARPLHGHGSRSEVLRAWREHPERAVAAVAREPAALCRV